MKKTFIDLNTNHAVNQVDPDLITATLSFRSLIKYLEKGIENAPRQTKFFLEYVLEKLKANKNIIGKTELSAINEFEEELSLIYDLFAPPVSDEKKRIWALGLPLKPQVFFGTTAFYNLFEDKNGVINFEVLNMETGNEAAKMQLKFLYSMVLEKLFHFPPMNNTGFIYCTRNEKTGLNKYYKIIIDTQFVEVTATKELPELDIIQIINEMQVQNFDWKIFLEKLPPDSFSFSGFSMITAIDVTAEQALENIKISIINKHDSGYENDNEFIITALKTLIENQDIEFNLHPLFRINNRWVFLNQHQNSMEASVLTGSSQNDDPLPCSASIEKYLDKPKIIFTGSIEDDCIVFDKNLVPTGIAGYGLIPVFSGTTVIGLLEVYTKKKLLLTVNMLSKLNMAIPLLSQVFQDAIDVFENCIEGIIKEKFTSLQPAVDWKFKEVALHYYNKNNHENSNEVNIVFKEVYPLYGAIDIRNSTIERNSAQAADLDLQFKLLSTTLTEIKQYDNLAITDNLIYKCGEFLHLIETNSNGEEKQQITSFLADEIAPFLLHFEKTSPQVKLLITTYRDACDETTGIAYQHKRSLEASIQTINTAIKRHLDWFANNVQTTYPCYFEKFRTDGIEYDIYIGQSITPDKPFNPLYLKNIRLGQLKSMIEIVKITGTLSLQLENKLSTTQLIFVRNTPIDISFRNDERRFDVEGTYNVRYQVIKKRIDKARIMDSGERLTQPGKIAIVYFTEKEAEEYVAYIHFLQNQLLLDDTIEFLTLEELQGVTGLKAIRVTIL